MLRLHSAALIAIVLASTPAGAVQVHSGSKAPKLPDAREFRSIFLGALGPRISKAAADALIYLPPRQLLAPARRGGGSAEMWREIEARYRRIGPAQAFSAGRRAIGTWKSRWKTARLEAQLRRQPVTFIVVPGVFSELISNATFQGLSARAKRSVFARQWRAALVRYRALSRSAPRRTAALVDHHLDFERIAPGRAAPQRKRSLASYFDVFSIDDRAGRTLLRVVVLKPAPGSLETMGSIARAARTFSRRIRKLLTILEATGHRQRHLALLGYSQGAMVSLQMMSLGHVARFPFLRRIEAVVALGGVVHGSHLADLAVFPGPTPHKSHRQLEALRWLARRLRLLGKAGRLQRIRRIAANTADMARALGRIVAADPGLRSAPRGWRLLQRIHLGSALGLGKALATRLFRLQKWSSAYDANLLKLRRLVGAAVTAVRGLTTRSRTLWWRTHRIRSRGVRYYALAATMADPRARSALERRIARHVAAYNPGATDLEVLGDSYREFKKQVGLRLNDSQVAVERARFWPALQRALNRRQAALRTTFLGILGTHHWGIALPFVVANRNGRRNPFPRAALLRALAAAVSLRSR